MPLKIKETMQLKYGVNSASEIEEIKQKTHEKQRYSFEYVFNKFLEYDYVVIDSYYINNHTPIRFICLKHYDKEIQTTTLLSLCHNKGGCKYCTREKTGNAIKGEKHYNWKGGVGTLQLYLRNKLKPWKQDSLREYNYKCVISGNKKNLIVHHLYSFALIFKEIIEELSFLLYNSLDKYTEKELKLLEKRCLEFHYKYGLGILLTKDIHKKFHKIYGKNNNTPEQFEEFIVKYYNGEFKEAENASFLFENNEVK